MVELRVIAGGLGELLKDWPLEVRSALRDQHAMLSTICDMIATMFAECPPDEVAARLAQTRRQLRRQVQQHRLSMEMVDDAMPEAAAYTALVRKHFRVMMADILKAGPEDFDALAAAHQKAAGLLA